MKGFEMLNNSVAKDTCFELSLDFLLTCRPWPSGYSVLEMSVIVLVASAIIWTIVFGNGLVITAVSRDRKLMRQRQNWLIISLASADLLVGLLVMPLTLAFEVIGEWIMGASLII